MAQARDAGICRRFAALVLDLCILLAVALFTALVLYKSGLAGKSGAHEALAPWPAPVTAMIVIGAFAAATVLAWRFIGGTPGSLLLGVVVCRAHDGARLGCLRGAARLLLAVGLAGIGTLWSFNGRLALHDRLSGTRAVLEDEALCTLADIEAREA